MNVRSARGFHVLFIAAAALECVCLPVQAADDEDKLQTPQAVALQFANDRIVRGSVLEVNDKEVRFQLNRRGTAPARYKLGTVRAIQTAKGIWLYNADKKRFEKAKIQAVKPLKPDQPRRQPATPSPKAALEEKQTVVAEGVGANAEEALKDAFRAAIRQVVGALVDSETLVKDDKIISDKVLTYSDGVIKKYDKISEKSDKGLVRLRIRAVVERRNLVARLREFKITVKDIEGKDVAAEVMTRQEARARATELLKKELDELPKVLVAEARKVDAKDYDEDAKTLRVDVYLKADKEKYTAFLKRLLPLLDKINLGKDLLIVECKPYEGGKDRRYRSKQRKYVNLPALGGFRNLRAKGFANQHLPADQKGWYLWVLSNIDAQSVRSRWDVYLVDSDLRKSLEGGAAQLSVLLSLEDAEGQAIAEDEIPLIDRSAYRPRRWLIANNFYPKESVNICLAPLSMEMSAERLDYKPVKLYRRHIDMTVAELNKVKNVKCRIVVRTKKSERTEQRGKRRPRK